MPGAKAVIGQLWLLGLAVNDPDRLDSHQEYNHVST